MPTPIDDTVAQTDALLHQIAEGSSLPAICVLRATSSMPEMFDDQPDLLAVRIDSDAAGQILEARKALNSLRGAGSTRILIELAPTLWITDSFEETAKTSTECIVSRTEIAFLAAGTQDETGNDEWRVIDSLEDALCRGAIAPGVFLGSEAEDLLDEMGIDHDQAAEAIESLFDDTSTD